MIELLGGVLMFRNSWDRFLDFLFYSDDLPSVYLPRMREIERLMKLKERKTNANK